MHCALAVSSPIVVKDTLAWVRSEETSTPVSVTRPTRGSFNSLCNSSDSSRWIWSSILRSRCGRAISEGTRHFLDLVGFQLVALLQIVEIAQGQTAFEAGLHFAHIILEALE